MKTTNLLAAVIVVALPLVTVLAQDTPKSEKSGQKEELTSDESAVNGMDMKADWEKQDAELDKLVASMNSAPADSKVDAIAALLTKLVEERKAMHAEIQQQIAANEKNDMNMCGMSIRMKECKCDNK